MIAARQTQKAFRKAAKRQRRAETIDRAASAPVASLPAAAVVRREKIAAPERTRQLAALYLLALALAEAVTVLIDTRWGVIGHAVVLALVIAQASVDAYAAGTAGAGVSRSLERRQANFLTALALVPLIRIVSLALPLGEFPELTWYGLIALPLLAATWSVARACGYGRTELGLRLDWRPAPIAVTTIVGLSGILLGYLEYRILRPEPLLDELDPLRVLAASAILLIGTGLTEELIFRGALQRAGSDLFGDAVGIGYSAVCFAVLHVGHRSALDVGFVFVIAVLFGVVVRRSGSLVGVTIAHGLTNICLFIVFPHLL